MTVLETKLFNYLRSAGVPDHVAEPKAIEISRCYGFNDSVAIIRAMETAYYHAAAERAGLTALIGGYGVGDIDPEGIAEQIPDNLRRSLIAYRDDHRPTGDFLRAVLSGDLFDAVGRGDVFSRRAFFAVCDWILWTFPDGSYGSPAKYEEWTKKGPIDHVD